MHWIERQQRRERYKINRSNQADKRLRAIRRCVFDYDDDALAKAHRIIERLSSRTYRPWTQERENAYQQQYFRHM